MYALPPLMTSVILRRQAVPSMDLTLECRGMEPGRRKTRNEHSSGGVVIAVRDGAPHVALIATRNKTRWGLPKGAVTDGETSEAAALREVLEETGIQARIVRPLDTIEYFFRAGDTLIQKRVDFYLMEYVAGELEPQLSEVDDVQWVELSASLQQASFDSERKLLAMALASSTSPS
jgi:8-oxo-dGTP pyrophosphatase MutT (NUDIX family)